MMTFNDFFHKYELKNKATSKIKYYQNLPSLSVNDVGIYLRDGIFKTDVRFVEFHPFRGSHWTLYVNKKVFDSSGCAPSNELSEFIIKLNGNCLYSENKIQVLTKKRLSYCAGYCLYIIYLTKVVGLDFKSAVLNLYYQMI